mmetsp:Transcript_27655/g.36287  ORF Transcript_27655/g.36287 Transcript_27655/m.36287 type:complete len:517 (+) Transcript_27655:76-1626(+)
MELFIQHQKHSNNGCILFSTTQIFSFTYIVFLALMELPFQCEAFSSHNPRSSLKLKLASSIKNAFHNEQLNGRAKNDPISCYEETFPNHPLSNEIQQQKKLMLRAAKGISTLAFSACLVFTQLNMDMNYGGDTDSVISRFQVVSTAANAAELTEEQRVVAQTWRVVDKLYVDRTFNGLDWFKVRQDAVKKKYKSMDEAYETISSFVAKLDDPYTRFLVPSKYRSLVNSATGEVAGIGVELFVDSKSGFVSLADVIPGSPAESAGLKPGDLLVEVSAENTKGEIPDDTATRLRGPIGTKVGLVAERDGEKIELILKREKVKIQGVRYSMETASSGKKVGVIKIKSFSTNTADDVSSALTALKKEGAQEFILDMRGNPGGYLPGGVDTARLFLPKDSSIVYVISKTGVVDAQSASVDGPEISVPLLVAVDERTASAAEVVSAALKENGRAKLVGKQTFGKGVIQTIEGLDGDAGVAVTVAKYETPKRNNINKVGIPVDIQFDCKATDPTLKCIPESLI